MSEENTKREGTVQRVIGHKPISPHVQVLDRTEEMNRREKEKKALLEKYPRTGDDSIPQKTSTDEQSMAWLDGPSGKPTTNNVPITPFRILYQNHRDEISWRLITPISWKMSPTEYYPEPGLQILTAMDEGKKEVRDFCAKRVLMWNFVGFPDLSEDMYDVTPWTISGITKSDFEKVIHLIKDKFAAAFCDINGQWYVCCTPDVTGKVLFDLLRTQGLPGIEMIQGGPIMLPMDFVDSQDTWLVDNQRFDVNPIGAVQ